MTEITWVAEVSTAHKGVPALAYEFIRQYSQAGATIVKFQFGWNKYTQEKHGLVYKPERYVDPWAEDLAKWCSMFGVELMASIWSLEGLETAQEVGMKRYKISSQVWKNDKKLAEAILAEGKETFVSGEFADINVHSLYAVSKYPTYLGEIHMPCKFGEGSWFHGYSDHAHGIEACLLAVARGALYIEKHVCLGKDDLTIRDTAFAATPDEFATLVRLGNGIRRHLDAGD